MKITIECSEAERAWILSALCDAKHCVFYCTECPAEPNVTCKKCLERRIEWRAQDGNSASEQSDILHRAIQTFGSDSQITVAIEEMSELQKELCKHFRGKGGLSRISEEIADTEIMLDQLKILFDCPHEVSIWRKEKLARLDKRIRAYQIEQSE